MELYQDVSTPNLLEFKLRKYQMSFKKNKHVKIDETYLDTQGRLKVRLSNVMDIWPPNFTKHDTQNLNII